MYDLKCKREGCKFNKNCRCSAQNISVDSNAVCVSYEPSENFKKIEKNKINQKAVRVNTLVDCDATKCLFCQNHECIANGITVATIDHNSPECLTIKPK